MSDAQPTPPHPGTLTSAPPPAWGQPQPGTLRYVEAHFGPVATFADRIPAYLIDVGLSLAANLLFVPGLVLFVVAADSSGSSDVTGGSRALALVGLLLAVLGYVAGLAFVIWNRVFRMGRRGQSIGKSRMDLMLVDARTGRPIGAGMCFVRELVLGLVNQVFLLSSLWMLWDPDRQTVADKTVSSTVIKIRP